MESRAKLFGHPIHPVLIVFPLGLLATSLIFDAVYLITKNPNWSMISYWMIAAGVIGGLIAAPFGTIDWLAIPQGTRAKSIGLVHGVGNVIVILLFGLGFWYRRGLSGHEPDAIALGLSIAGFGLAGVTGWLGGELSYRLGIGVDPGANVDAPNSLSGRLASETSKTGN